MVYSFVIKNDMKIKCIHVRTTLSKSKHTENRNYRFSFRKINFILFELMLPDCSNYFIFYHVIFFPCLPINNKFQITILNKIFGQMTTLIEFIVFCNVCYNDFNNCLIINCFIIPFHVFIRMRHC